MANPTPYERAYSFAGFQANSPQKPLPGQKVDTELDNLERTTTETISALADIRRSDGRLKNGIVTIDSLSPEMSTGVQAAVPWTTLTSYEIGAVVFYNTGFYRALIDHVSGVFADDFAAGKWLLFADLGPIVTDAGVARDEAVAAKDIAVSAAGTATSAAGAASSSAGAAAGSASTASTSAGTATTQAGIATTKAGEAAASAASALASKNAAEAAAATVVHGFKVTQRFSAADGNLTAGQTSFTVPAYDAPYGYVYRNGSKLVNGVEVTFPTGTSILLASPVGGSDVLEFEGFGVFNLTTIPAGSVTGLDEAVDDRVATLLVAGSGIRKVYDDAANTLTVSAVPARGAIYGLGLANNATDAVNDIDIAIGEAASDDTAPYLMQLGSALTKRLDAAWAVGTGNGGRDTGSVADGTWHLWLIQRSDTGVVDALFSLSATAPTMPANYDRKRRIGAVVRASGSILGFFQIGNGAARQYDLTTVPALNYDAQIGTTPVTVTLSVPTGIVVEAKAIVLGTNAGTGTVIYVYPTRKANQASSTSVAPLAQLALSQIGGVISGEINVLTDVSGQVKAVAIAASTTTRIATLGWTEFL